MHSRDSNSNLILPVDFCFDAQLNGGAMGQAVDGATQLDFSRAGAGEGALRQAGFSDQQCAALTKRLANLGVRAYLPTLITAGPDVLEANLKEVSRFRATAEGKHCPGIHLEACFFQPVAGYIGAHPTEHCISGRDECLETYRRLQDAADGSIKLMTVGPNVEGIRDTIELARKEGVVVALGHFGPHPDKLDDPDEISRINDCIQAAVDAGASLSTHLGNGTRTLLHRHGGHVSFQMSHPQLSASLITDGAHLPPEFIRQAISTLGAAQVWLVSDASALEGAPAGEYDLWEDSVEVVRAHTGFRDTFKVAPAGKPGLLAGSWATLPDCMNHLVDLMHAWEKQTEREPHYSVEDICAMACLNPLAALGFAPGDFEALDGARLTYNGREFVRGDK